MRMCVCVFLHCYAASYYKYICICDGVTIFKDFEYHKGKSEYEDVLQSGTGPSTMTNRGHQTPAAFLILASGLDKVSLRVFTIVSQLLSFCLQCFDSLVGREEGLQLVNILQSAIIFLRETFRVACPKCLNA